MNLTATCCRRIWGSGSRDLGESDSVTAKATVEGESNLRKFLGKDGRMETWCGHLAKRKGVGAGVGDIQYIECWCSEREAAIEAQERLWQIFDN